MSAPPRIARILLGPAGLVIAVLWGFAEATLFFIIPDVFLSFTAMFSVRRSIVHMLAITLGAVTGGILMFLWAVQGPGARHAVEHVPFVGSAMFERIDRAYVQSGIVALVEGPMSGIPYKAYAVEAPGRVSLPAFMLWSIPARLERFVITWLPFAAFGFFMRTRKRDLARWAMGAHLAYWCVVYSVYWSII